MLLCHSKRLSEGGRAGVCPAVVALGPGALGLGQGLGVRGGPGAARRKRPRVVQGVLPAVAEGALAAHCWGHKEGGGEVPHLHRDRERPLRLVQPEVEEGLELAGRVLPLVDGHLLLRVLRLLVLPCAGRHFDSRYQRTVKNLTQDGSGRGQRQGTWSAAHSPPPSPSCFSLLPAHCTVLSPSLFTAHSCGRVMVWSVTAGNSSVPQQQPSQLAWRGSSAARSAARSQESLAAGLDTRRPGQETDSSPLNKVRLFVRFRY